MEPFYNINNCAESTLPSIMSDEEESFVVLGRDPPEPQDVESLPEVLPPLRTNRIHEMQNLLEMRISQITAEPVPMPSMPTASGLEVLSATIAQITISPDTSIEEVQKQVEELIKENEKLKNVIAQNNISMKTQYDRFLAYRDQVANVMKVNKDKFNEAKLYIDKCKEDNTKLSNEIEVYVNIKKLQEEEIISLKDKLKQLQNSQTVPVGTEQDDLEFDSKTITEQFENLKTELAESNIKNAQLQAENDRLATRLANLPKLEDDLTVKNGEIDDLKSEIEKLREEIHISKISKDKNTELKCVLEESKKQFNEELKLKDETLVQLNRELQSTGDKLRELQIQFNPNFREEHIQVRAQLSLAQRTITALEQEREELINKIEDYRRLLQESNAKTDEIFALKEQVELFRNDFEAERNSKEAMKQQKDQTVEDLKNVQQRNKQLQEEVERLRPLAEKKKPQPAGAYECPKCNFGFASYQSLENHVHRCLELDD